MIIYSECNLKSFTSFKENALAKYIFEATNSFEIFVLKYLFDYFEIQYHVLAKGSKVIFSNSYITKPILLISSKFEEIYELDNFIMVSAGHENKKLILRLANNNKGGFHHLYPLPCSIGGMTYMNASDNKVAISNFIKSVIVLDENNKIKILSNKECNFRYRNSIFMNKKYIILYVILKYEIINKDIIIDQITDAINYRIKNQEINNTFGSIFKNGNNYLAYKLIGSIRNLLPNLNNIKLSNKHNNFLININCKAEEVIMFINLIKKLVFEKYNVLLKEEVNIFD